MLCNNTHKVKTKNYNILIVEDSEFINKIIYAQG